MKTILAITALAFILFVQSGCTANTGVSVGHDDHAHGVAVKGSTQGGVSGGVKAY
jgi:predicted small secreted protein